MKKTMMLLFMAAVFLLTGCGAPQLKEDSAADLFGCKAFLLDKGLSSTAVTDLYLKETEKGKAEGYTPVILALDRRVREMAEINISEFDSPEEFRESVLSDTEGGRQLLDEGFEQLSEGFGVEFGFNPFAEDDAELDALVRETAAHSSHELLSVKESESMMFDGEGVYLVRVPTTNPWEVTAWLPFCGWNECPAVEDMVKICRFWYEEYGALPAFISGDMMMFLLDRPISDKQTAREISRQHAAFCSEFLWMTGLDYQTAEIMTSSVWTFWWD